MKNWTLWNFEKLCGYPNWRKEFFCPCLRQSPKKNIKNSVKTVISDAYFINILDLDMRLLALRDLVSLLSLLVAKLLQEQSNYR